MSTKTIIHPEPCSVPPSVYLTLLDHTCCSGDPPPSLPAILVSIILAFLKQHFRWLSMSQDTHAFAVCWIMDVCFRARASSQPGSSLLYASCATSPPLSPAPTSLSLLPQLSLLKHLSSIFTSLLGQAKNQILKPLTSEQVFSGQNRTCFPPLQNRNAPTVDLTIGQAQMHLLIKQHVCCYLHQGGNGVCLFVKKTTEWISSKSLEGWDMGGSRNVFSLFLKGRFD